MKYTIVGLLLIVLTGVVQVEAHAFLKDAKPAVGSTVQTSPNEVRIRFTENIEPAFSSIQVFDASEKEVDKRDVHLDRSDRALLHVSLPRLGAGIYKVVWRVVSVDTHVTNGSFTFRVTR
jgi:methionine-rich copper-binding protein CopC